MADILIRGMAMPRNCPMCILAHFNKLDEFTGCDAAPGKRYVPHSDGQFWNSSERPSWCPLAPLPEGHGRLGDLETAEAILHNKSFDLAGTSAEYNALNWALRQIKALPTIVPAEGGTDNG